MANWWDTPAYAAKQASMGSGFKVTPKNAKGAPAQGYNKSVIDAIKARNGAPTSDQDAFGGYLSGNIDYTKAARDIYEPSLDYLDDQAGAAKARNAKNDRDIASMYAGLVKSIQGDASGIAGNYNDSINQVGQGTKAAVGAIDRTYDTSAAEQEAMLRRLGIQAAAPDVLAQGTRDESFFKNMASQSGKSVADMLAAERAGALEYNTSQANISKQTGVDARAKNKLSLEDVLSQIMGRRADLETQINSQAANMQSSATEQLLKAQSDAQDQDMKQARLALDTAKFQASNSQSQQQNNKDPWANVSLLAQQLYPGGDYEHGSGPAIRAIQDTVRLSSAPLDLNDFIQQVMKRNPGAHDKNQLAQLATAAYQGLYGKK